MKNKSNAPKKETGWDILRKENESKFSVNFAPIRSAIRRNEFLGSVIELFVSAIVGIGKMNLTLDDDKEETKDEENK